MATKKKTTTNKEGAGGIIFTENAIVITLDANARRKAKNCLEKNGRITFSVKEHSLTRLPQILDNGKLID